MTNELTLSAPERIGVKMEEGYEFNRWNVVTYPFDDEGVEYVRHDLSGADELTTLRAENARLRRERDEADGMAMVPRHPTDTMMQAGLHQSSADSTWDDVFSIWVDMFGASIAEGLHDTPPPTEAPEEVRVSVKRLEWKRADLSAWGEIANAAGLRYRMTWTYRDDPEVWFLVEVEKSKEWETVYEGGDEGAAYQSAQADYERRTGASS